MKASVANELTDLVAHVKAARQRGIDWLLSHLAADGEPVDARRRNGWGRVPWALAVCGESAAGAAVVDWALRHNQLSPEGAAFAPPLGAGRFPAYAVAHFAIGAWLLERFDASLKAMELLRRLQDPATGGLPIAADSPVCDLLSTAQVGLAAVITGQDDMAKGCHRWVMDLLQQQPAGEKSKFYSFRRGAELLLDPEAALRWLAVTDFSQPRQTYYTTGMAAVFLAAHGQRAGDAAALTHARACLRFNAEGTSAQFDDESSVQVCKFGWGVAAVMAAEDRAQGDADSEWLPHAVKMARWFMDHQADDGSWCPSSFLVAKPDDVDLLIKTAEHLMELNALLAALSAASARQVARVTLECRRPA